MPHRPNGIYGPDECRKYHLGRWAPRPLILRPGYYEGKGNPCEIAGLSIKALFDHSTTLCTDP